MIKLVLLNTGECPPTRGAINELFIGDRNRIPVQVPIHGLLPSDWTRNDG